MSGDNTKRFIKMHKCKKIEIKDFTKPDICETKSALFRLPILPVKECCIVEIYPNGISPQYHEYVSVKVSKFPPLDENIKWYDNFVLYIFLSVIDINGIERCRQSFVQENSDLRFDIPNFLKRSFLVSLSEEFLPEDTLTLHCELIGNYSLENVNLMFDQGDSYIPDEYFEHSNAKIEEGSASRFDKCNERGRKRLSLELPKLASSVLGLFLCTSSGLIESRRERITNILETYDETDEIRQTYFSSLEMFKKYLVIKEKVRNLATNEDYSGLKGLATILCDEYNDNVELHAALQLLQPTENEEGSVSSFVNNVDHSTREKFKTIATNLALNADKQLLDVLEDGDIFRSLMDQIAHSYTELLSSSGEDEGYETKTPPVLADMHWNLAKYPDAHAAITFDMIENLIQLVEANLKNFEEIIIALVIEETMKESERINYRNDYFLDIGDEENTTEQPSNFEKTWRILENIKEIFQDIIESFHSCLKLSKEDERLAEIDAFLDQKKNDMSLESDRVFDSVENQKKWNFHVETNDGVIFAIPFDDAKVTLGSKLISNSVVFERMLENPMREKNEKRVKLNDTDCCTFINFLHFIQTKEIKAETFSELCDSYEFADQYDVPEMMSLCVERMRSFMSLSNTDEIEDLAHLHADKNLSNLLQLFSRESTQLVSGVNENHEIHLNENLTDSVPEEKDGENTSFEFYQ